MYATANKKMLNMLILDIERQMLRTRLRYR